MLVSSSFSTREHLALSSNVSSSAVRATESFIALYMTAPNYMQNGVLNWQESLIETKVLTTLSHDLFISSRESFVQKMKAIGLFVASVGRQILE